MPSGFRKDGTALGFQKGNVPYNKGKKGLYKHSELSKMKMRVPHIGSGIYVRLNKKQPYQKKEHSPYGKGKSSWIAGKKIGPHSDEHKRKLSEALLREKNPHWRGGISYKPYSVDWTETLRRSIRERDHYICQLCNEYGNTVHHIDYDKKNSNPDNLINLCRKCNIKVNHNREYWSIHFKQILLKN